MAPKAKQTDGDKKAPRSDERGAIVVSDISPDDFLYVYKYYSQARTYEHAKLLKLKALVALLSLFPRDWDFDIRYGLWALNVIADTNAPTLSKMAVSAVLDYCWPEWKQDIKPEFLGPTVERHSPEVYMWRKEVLAKDNYACTQCGSKKKLEAHHILRWRDFPHARLLVDNGTTLCSSCHMEITREQRRGGNACVA